MHKEALRRVLRENEDRLDMQSRLTLQQIKNSSKVPDRFSDATDSKLAEILPRAQAIRLGRFAHEVMALRSALANEGSHQ